MFFIPADSTSELLIYDFSVSAGDTAFVYEQHPFGNDFYPVQYGYISTDSVMVNGSYRKRINLNGNPGTWVEGIGCTKGLFRESWPNVSNWYNDLECMSDGYLTLYPSPSMGPCSLVSGVNEASEQIQALEIYPNPTNGKLNIHSEAEMNKIEVVDLLGRVISFMELKGMNAEIDLSDTPSGVYFIRISHQKENSVTKKIVKQ